MLIQGAQFCSSLVRARLKELEAAPNSFSDMYLHFLFPLSWEALEVSDKQSCPGDA